MKLDQAYLDKYPLITGANQSILRTVCKPVKSINHEIKQFAQLLYQRMQEHNGVGIAAPQVGRNLRMAAFATLDTSTKEREIIRIETMINPQVIQTSTETQQDTEGCLSLPGEEGQVSRPVRATIQWTDLKGKKQLRKVEGYNARIMLHEIDHLDGVLFIDKTI